MSLVDILLFADHGLVTTGREKFVLTGVLGVVKHDSKLPLEDSVAFQDCGVLVEVFESLDYFS